MLDILCVGVEDADTFILVLFINCGREVKGAHKLTVRDTRVGGGREIRWQAPKCTWRDLDSPSQTHTLLSRLQVARRLPDGAQATDLTSFSWPSRVVAHCTVKGDRVSAGGDPRGPRKVSPPNPGRHRLLDQEPPWRASG